LSYQYRAIRAIVRYYCKYTTAELNNMNLKELVEAFHDVVYVRGLRSKLEAED
jgi:hypothetical protein